MGAGVGVEEASHTVRKKNYSRVSIFRFANECELWATTTRNDPFYI